MLQTQYLPYPLLQEQNFGVCRLVLHIWSYALDRAFDNDRFGSLPVLQTVKLSFNVSRDLL